MNIVKGVKGEGKLGLIVALLIVLIAVYAAYKIIPVKINIANFNEHLEKQCKQFQSGSRITTDKVKKNILNRAEELGLPLDKKSVTVKKKPGRIVIEVKYTVDVSFPGYTFKMVGDNLLERQIF